MCVIVQGVWCPRIAWIACFPLLPLSLKAANPLRTAVPPAALPLTCILLSHIENNTMRKQQTIYTSFAHLRSIMEWKYNSVHKQNCRKPAAHWSCISLLLLLLLLQIQLQICFLMSLHRQGYCCRKISRCS